MFDQCNLCLSELVAVINAVLDGALLFALQLCRQCALERLGGIAGSAFESSSAGGTRIAATSFGEQQS